MQLLTFSLSITISIFFFFVLDIFFKEKNTKQTFPLSACKINYKLLSNYSENIETRTEKQNTQKHKKLRAKKN